MEWDGFPTKPKFQVGDEVYYFKSDERTKVFGVVRHIRATVSIEKGRKTPSYVHYGYTLDPMSPLGAIEESALYHANTLIGFTREVHDQA